MEFLHTHEEKDLARMSSRGFTFRVSEYVRCLISITAVSNDHSVPHPPTNPHIEQLFNSDLRLLITKGILDGRKCESSTHFNFIAYTMLPWKDYTIIMSLTSLDDESLVSRIPTDNEAAAAIQAMTACVLNIHP